MSSETYYNDRWQDENTRPFAPNEKRIQHIIDAVRHYANKPGVRFTSCLEVGCGNGWILKRISESFADLAVYGIEPSSVGAQNAQKRVPKATIDCATLESTSIDGKFDVVICSEILEHVADQQSFIQKLADRLTKKGLLVLTMPNGLFRSKYFTIHELDPQPIENWLTGDALRHLMDNCFSDIRIGSFDLSFWRKIHPRINKLRQATMHVRGGWRFVRMIDDLFLLPRLRGLYLITTAKKVDFNRRWHR